MKNTNRIFFPQSCVPISNQFSRKFVIWTKVKAFSNLKNNRYFASVDAITVDCNIRCCVQFLVQSHDMLINLLFRVLPLSKVSCYIVCEIQSTRFSFISHNAPEVFNCARCVEIATTVCDNCYYEKKRNQWSKLLFARGM